MKTQWQLGVLLACLFPTLLGIPQPSSTPSDADWVSMYLTTGVPISSEVPPLKNNSLLWKIEGEGIEPSYLYGTMHLLKQEDFYLPDRVKTAFGQCDQLVMELDMDDPGMQQDMLAHAPMKEGKLLSDLLSEKDYHVLDKRLQEAVGVGVAAFDSWTPFLVSSLLLKPILGSEVASYELAFLQMAQADGIDILGLETVAEQVGLFHQIPYEDQTLMLSSYLHDQQAMATEFQQVADLYLNERVHKLYRLTSRSLKKGKLDPALMLDQRNQNWIPQMERLAQEKPTFFAVGAGHLGGEQGVLQLLEEAGYTLTPL